MQDLLQQTNLPIVPHLADVCRGVQETGFLILEAAAGSGKSTLVPLALLERGLPSSGEGPAILMLEPRRLATVGIARRMADLLGEEVGQTVGYSVRLERKVGPHTRIEVVTEGLFIRRLQDQPDLPGVEYVIFDEFHERSAATDLAFALVMDLIRMGRNLKVLIMSATLDGTQLEGVVRPLLNVPEDESLVHVCPVAPYPLEISYRPLPHREPLGIETAKVVQELLTLGCLPLGQTMLVFLPGKGEIEQTRGALRDFQREGMIGEDIEILPLHGGLSLEEQRRVLTPLSEDQRGISRKGEEERERKRGPLARRRIVLATNIAETGLTVPGVSLVVDTGLVRLERFHQPTGMNRLSLEAASESSIAQRAGRAARLGPGRCIRLWDPAEPRPAATEPEILRTELSGLVLESCLWGATHREALPWLELPPQRTWDQGRELLQEIEFIGPAGEVLPAGRRAAHLGVHPRLAALVLAAEKLQIPAEGCLLAAFLSERDGSGIPDENLELRIGMLEKSVTGLRKEKTGALFPASGIDGGTEKGALRGTGAVSENRAKPWVERIVEIARDLYRRLGPDGSSFSLGDGRDPSWLGRLLVHAFPDRIGRQVERGCFQFPSGRQARLEGSLATALWLVAPEVDAGLRLGRIHLAVSLSEEEALRGLHPLVRRTTELVWDGLVPRTAETLLAGRLVIREERRKSTTVEVIEALPVLLEREGLGVLPFEALDGAPRRFLERLRFWASHGGPVDPLLWEERPLIEEAPHWLGPYVWAGRTEGEGPIIDGEGLLLALQSRLGWELLPILDREVPEYFRTPTGRQRRIDYGDGTPRLHIRIQEVFGCGASPRICGVPLVFHLLSPAHRPIQVTDDLERFWSGSYKEVRKEMKGRYPKHFWPENPLCTGKDEKKKTD